MIKIVKYLFILLFLNSCGYSPIYELNQKLDFKLGVINFSGDKKIGREIEKGLEKFKNNETQNIFDLDFVVTKKEVVATKDKKGDPSSFKKTIELDLDLTNKSNGKTFTKNFTKETTFSSMDNKFELDQYKNNIEKNMIFKILQDVNVFFNIIENDL
tara:strand:- start:715 stop:1185 length:471 start_codon:yes stop_codon:yes gene_type:complete